MLQLVQQLQRLRTADCDSSCSCNCHCDFRFHCASAAALEGTFWQRQSTIFIASCTWQARATICLCPPPPFLQSLLIYVGRERGRRGCAGSAHTFNSFLWPLTLTFMALGARWEAFAYNSPIILTQCASKTLFRLDLDTSVDSAKEATPTHDCAGQSKKEKRTKERGSRAGTLLIRRVLLCTVRKVNNDKAL